jgi:hypothetical protein
MINRHFFFSSDGLSFQTTDPQEARKYFFELIADD